MPSPQPMVALLCAQAYYRLGHVEQARRRDSGPNQSECCAGVLFRRCRFRYGLGQTGVGLALGCNELLLVAVLVTQRTQEGRIEAATAAFGAQLPPETRRALRGGVLG